jgi:hypothetical protein
VLSRRIERVSDGLFQGEEAVLHLHDRVLEPSAPQLFATFGYLYNGSWPSWEAVALYMTERLGITYQKADKEIADDARAGNVIPFLHEYDSGMKRWHLRVPTPVMSEVATVLAEVQEEA